MCNLSLSLSSSWDEHVFELVLPKACMVGHVDFKFVLNSSITNIPQIQVTLLKNKAPGLGKVNGESGNKNSLLSRKKRENVYCRLVWFIFIPQMNILLCKTLYCRDSSGQADCLPLVSCPALKWREEWTTTPARLLRWHPVHGHRGFAR